MSESIAKRLPTDSVIALTDKNGVVQISISMTLTEPRHALALIDAVHVALLPLLQLGTGSESAPGPAQCSTSPPAREQSGESLPEASSDGEGTSQ